MPGWPTSSEVGDMNGLPISVPHGQSHGPPNHQFTGDGALGGDPVQHLPVFGEPPGFVLAEDQVAVDPHVKDAAPASDQLTINPPGLLDCVRQTGGLRSIVSFYAVFDRNLHGLPPSSADETPAASNPAKHAHRNGTSYPLEKDEAFRVRLVPVAWALRTWGVRSAPASPC